MKLMVKELNDAIKDLKQIPKAKSVVENLERIANSITERFVGEKVNGLVEDLKFIIKKNIDKIEENNHGFNEYIDILVADLKKGTSKEKTNYEKPEGVVAILKMVNAYNERYFRHQLVDFNYDFKLMYGEIDELENKNYKNFLFEDVIAKCNIKINESLSIYDKEFKKWVDWEINRNNELVKKNVQYKKEDIELLCENLENARDTHNKMSENIIGIKQCIDELNYFVAHKDELNKQVEKTSKKESYKEK